MRLLEVNGISLLGASHQEAVNSLRTSGDVIHLLICEGYDAVEVERLLSEGKLIREPKSTSESVSSLDRVDFDEPNHFKVTYRRFIIKLFTFNTFSTVVQGDEAQEDGSCDHAEPEIARVTGSLPTSPLLGDRDSKTSDKVICTTTKFQLFLIKISNYIFLQVLDAVRAAEMLVSNMVPKSPGPNRVDMKTTTIVMSKHTLAPQTSTVS